jgi:virginiamycin B lyase
MSNSPLVPVVAVTLLCAAPTAFAQQAPTDFPDGPGKSTVTALCGACHDVNRVRAGYTPEGWRTVVRMMLNFEVPIPEDQVGTVTDYLIKNFPERPRPAAVIVDGPAKVSIKQWPVPTPGSRPHDPMAAKDGAIWYTGQLSSKLGRLDPRTGAFKEYPVRMQTAPHGLAEDNDGNIWFTGNHLGLIGKLDPKTGAVAEYKTQAKDPHTIAIDQSGIVWFTAQNANVVGRLDPTSVDKTGEVKLVTSPTPNSRPYGLVINSKGVPVFVEFGTNKIATIDPKTMAIKEYALPSPASRPRRLALSPDDVVWYADFSRGYLGRLDLATGEHKEWASPSGPQSQPYGIVFTKGAIWYNESGAKPNTIVRFDPKTEKFQSWAIPGGGDIVRNMAVNRDGNPVTANSLVNQVGLVEVQ